MNAFNLYFGDQLLVSLFHFLILIYLSDIYIFKNRDEAHEIAPNHAEFILHHETPVVLIVLEIIISPLAVMRTS